ncbi:MAG: ATP-dependent helicase [Bacteroidales bacterium]|nr:ATP-dependent helicase [Bacteroidales bacterium]
MKVIRMVNLLKEEKLLADTRDISAFINMDQSKSRSGKILSRYVQLENFLSKSITGEVSTISIKELNGLAIESGCHDSTPQMIKTILNFWAIKNWIVKKKADAQGNHLAVRFNMKELLDKKLEKRHALSGFIMQFLVERARKNPASTADLQLIPVEFSELEIKESYDSANLLFKPEISLDDIEDSLFFLSKIEALHIEGGFMVIYNRLNIDRLEKNPRVQYKNEDYEKLSNFYKARTQQIHIVGEYARKMLEDYNGALSFVDDYFRLNYSSFLNKYFPGKEKQDSISKSLTPAKFRQIFGELTPRQLEIINNNDSQNIVVAAGPGSGKTRVLVHKLASLLLVEEVKSEQLLMLTFSRAAATEFKVRLKELIGNAAYYTEIKTFHSYCFDLLGLVGNIEQSDGIITRTIEKIRNGEVEQFRITKTALVIDEAQDMSENEYSLVKTLMEANEEMRVIAVGDDDQNIFEFRGSDSRYMQQFIFEQGSKKYELLENFRSGVKLVAFANGFVSSISQRFKEYPIIPVRKEKGEIKIFDYNSEQLTLPVVRNILATALEGTTAVLAYSNFEAFEIAGMLIREGVKARLIQSGDEFKIGNLLEAREFLEYIEKQEHSSKIPEEIWENAKSRLKEKYRNSPGYVIFLQLIRKFQMLYPSSKYLTDLKHFISESKHEDFVDPDSRTIIVSTMHKAKGKEFDNVFLVLNKTDLSTDEKKRVVYVALSRARNKLIIHNNINFAQRIKLDGLVRHFDSRNYSEPPLLNLQLSHSDIYLGYFKYIQNRIARLKGDETFRIQPEGLSFPTGDLILKFSKSFLAKIENYIEKGYHFTEARVAYILYWKDKEEDIELKIVLPFISFARKSTLPYPEDEEYGRLGEVAEEE